MTRGDGYTDAILKSSEKPTSEVWHRLLFVVVVTEVLHICAILNFNDTGLLCVFLGFLTEGQKLTCEHTLGDCCHERNRVTR